MKWITLGWIVVSAALASGCVTTSTSPFEQKKDLDKAVDTYTQIGYKHFENDNLFEAKQSLSRALEIDKKASGAHLGLARVFSVEEENELAEDHYGKAIRYDGGSEARFQYGVFLYNHQRYEDALNVFSKVVEDEYYSRRARSFEFLALTARRLERYDRAIEAYKKAIVLDRLLVNSYIGLADLHESQDQPDEAMQAYQGFLGLVRANRAEHSAHTLWLGIRLAHANGQPDLSSSLQLQLRSRFPNSEEYRLYQRWQEEQEAT